MSLRPPSQYSASALPGGAGEGVLSPLDHEIAAEKAASLGRAGEKVGKALARLHACERSATERPQCLKAAAEAVHGYFIQRELCGLRRHHDAIRDYAIPAEVLVRLGAA